MSPDVFRNTNSIISFLTRETHRLFPVNRFQVEPLLPKNLARHNLQLIHCNGLRGCIDDRNRIDNQPRSSIKRPGADLADLALEAIQKKCPLQQIATNWKKKGKKICLHDGQHGNWNNPAGTKTDCGFNDCLDEILFIYLNGYKKIPDNSARHLLNKILEQKTPKQRFEALVKKSGAQVHEHYAGDHGATDIVLNMNPGKTLIPLQKNGERHFVCDLVDQNIQDMAVLTAVTVAILSPANSRLNILVLT